MNKSYFKLEDGVYIVSDDKGNLSKRTISDIKELEYENSLEMAENKIMELKKEKQDHDKEIPKIVLASAILIAISLIGSALAIYSFFSTSLITWSIFSTLVLALDVASVITTMKQVDNIISFNKLYDKEMFKARKKKEHAQVRLKDLEYERILSKSKEDSKVNIIENNEEFVCLNNDKPKTLTKRR